MGRFIRRLLTLKIAFWIVGGVASAVAAMVAKRSIVSQGDELSDEIDLVAIYEGYSFTSRAPAFRGGSVLAWYSGARIDLRGATLDPAGGRLRARALFAGLQVLVPETWAVEIEARAFAGSISNDVTPPGLKTGPVLVVDGWACFGGIKITTEDDADWSGQAARADSTTVSSASSDADEDRSRDG